jgi:hypothetical protein
MNKYKNKKVVYKGIRFDSMAEMSRYITLELLKRAGEIIGEVELQPKFILQPGFTDSVGIKHQAVTYRADFKYYDAKKRRWIVEDVKGFQTKEFKIKWKWTLFKFYETGIHFILIK